MIRKNLRGDFPVIHESAFVDPAAILCCMVNVEENVFIGPYAVIRADEFFEDVARTNIELVRAYKAIQNEL